MEYVMKGGKLWRGGTLLAVIKSQFPGSEKRVSSPDGRLLLKVSSGSGAGKAEEWDAETPEGDVRMKARPGYREGEDTSEAGWKPNRIPRMDHADILEGSVRERLRMIDGRNYVVDRDDGAVVMEMVHRGIAGGWDIKASGDCSPEDIAAFFIFSKYIEAGNEFLIV